mgnify:FL=1|jgi:hypothetical protein
MFVSLFAQFAGIVTDGFDRYGRSLIFFLWGFHFFRKIQRPINRIFALWPFLATNMVNSQAAKIACRIACKFVGIGMNSREKSTVESKNDPFFQNYIPHSHLDSFFVR